MRAAELAPGNHELVFWAGLAAAEGGDMATALERVRARDRDAARAGPSCSSASQPEIAPGAAAVRAALRDAAERGTTPGRCSGRRTNVGCGVPPGRLPPWTRGSGGPTTRAGGRRR